MGDLRPVCCSFQRLSGNLKIKLLTLQTPHLAKPLCAIYENQYQHKTIKTISKNEKIKQKKKQDCAES